MAWQHRLASFAFTKISLASLSNVFARQLYSLLSPPSFFKVPLMHACLYKFICEYVYNHRFALMQLHFIIAADISSPATLPAWEAKNKLAPSVYGADQSNESLNRYSDVILWDTISVALYTADNEKAATVSLATEVTSNGSNQLRVVPTATIFFSMVLAATSSLYYSFVLLCRTRFVQLDDLACTA